MARMEVITLEMMMGNKEVRQVRLLNMIDELDLCIFSDGQRKYMIQTQSDKEQTDG